MTVRPEALLRDLVALPSVNPAFLPKADRRGGERVVAEFLASLAARTGLEVEYRPVSPGRANLLVSLRCPGKVRQRIVLAPHLDTVGEPHMPDTLFQPKVRGGRLYGRGACDTKGSVAVMFAALLSLASRPRRPKHTEVMFAGLVDEEYAQAGSRALVRQGFRADLAIVGEPTRLKVVTAHKGALWLRAETRGLAAHGSRPDLGRNAVHLMARVIDCIETDYAAALRGLPRHPLLGQPTVNVGKVGGGTQANIVPDHCEIEIDRRTLPGERDGRVMNELRACLKKRGLEARVAKLRAPDCMPLEANPELVWIRLLLRAASQTAPLGANYFSDAGVLAAGGVPSVLFGPGDIAQAHTLDEWVAVPQLDLGARVLDRFFKLLP